LMRVRHPIRFGDKQVPLWLLDLNKSGSKPYGPVRSFAATRAAHGAEQHQKKEDVSEVNPARAELGPAIPTFHKFNKRRQTDLPGFKNFAPVKRTLQFLIAKIAWEFRSAARTRRCIDRTALLIQDGIARLIEKLLGFVQRAGLVR